ncbi:MAG: Unknown protein [uncultured Sulfurovum sp.]|uniref:Uncharacterized protein n=1 Tax=uncultured Sulfurovum sp. TaxID=269237 RepID=A0A6S6RTM8_9BACT|nr:MAG: Unknown protein [uncultured Sulfurovum sp.]
MSVEKNNMLNFETNKVDLVALQREIDEEVIIEDNEACDRDMLDQMVYQLGVKEKKKKRNPTKKIEKILLEVNEKREMHKDYKFNKSMSKKENDEFMQSLNDSFLDLSRKLKDVTVYYIALKSKVRVLESKKKQHEDIDQELKDMFAQIRSHRRYNDLSEVDFNEVVRRVIVEIDNHNGENTKKNKNKKRLPWKIVFALFFVGILILGYVYKLNKIEINHHVKENYEKK